MISKKIKVLKRSNVYETSIIELPKITNRSGNITSVSNNLNIPFAVRRIYYLYDIPSGSERGGHAHKDLHQLIIAISGSFDITLDDGTTKKTVRLDRPNYGLLIVPGIWRELKEFSSGAICLVLASNKYDENDYIRSYNEFKEFYKR